MPHHDSNLPLSGIKVVEFAGLAPGPFAGMVLSDFGADVIRIDRPDDTGTSDMLARGKRSIAVSPKTSSGRSIIMALIQRSDVLIDPFRPGTLEKLGLGPDECLKRNPKLVYARLTGYRRTGPYAKLAGHDINYAALSGVLAMLRPNGGVPSPPMNLLADFAGGGSICVMGILMALIARAKSGKGQIVEADMMSGARYVSSFPLLARAENAPLFSEPAGQNILDGGAPFYAVYRTSDDKFVSLGALEPRFYAVFLQTLLPKLPESFLKGHSTRPEVATQYDRDTWPALRSFLEAAFATRTRDEWEGTFLDTDSCVAPVLEPEEAKEDGAVPAPAPVLRSTPARLPEQSLAAHYLEPGSHSAAVLADLGRDEVDIQRLVADGVVRQVRHRQESRL